MKTALLAAAVAASLGLAAAPARGEPVRTLVLGDTVTGTVEAGISEVVPVDVVEGTLLDAKMTMAAGSFPRISILQPDRSLVLDIELYGTADARGGTLQLKKVPIEQSGRHYLLLKPDVAGDYKIQVKGKPMKKAGYEGFILPNPPTEVAFGALPGSTVSVTLKQARGSALAPRIVAVLGPDGQPVDLEAARAHKFTGTLDQYKDVPLALLGQYRVQAGTQTGLYGDMGVVQVSVKLPKAKKGKRLDTDLVVDPFVDAVNPSSGFDNMAYTGLVVNGEFFGPGPSVRLEGPGTVDGTAVARVDDGTVAFDADLTGFEAGAYDVVVSYANGAEGRKSGAFTVLPTPIPSALDPATGFDNRTQTFTVTGSRFQSGLAVGVRPSAGGSIVPGTVTASTDTSATVDLPLLDAALGSWDLVVVNPDGGTRTLASALTVVRGPRLISASPLLGHDNDAARTVSVSGSWFQAGMTCVLEAAGQAAIPSVVTGLVETAASATFDLRGQPGGNRTLRVTNPDGGTVTYPAPFVLARAPRITSLSRSRGFDVDTLAGVAAGGTDLVSGAQATLEFASATTASATNETVNGAGTQITFDLPLAGAPSDVHDLRVTNPDGGSTVLASSFHVLGTRTLASGAAAAGRPCIAYNAEDDCYYVVQALNDGTQWDVRGRRFSAATGLPLEAEIAITSGTDDGSATESQSDPCVVYAPEMDRYLVVYSWRDPSASGNQTKVFAQFVGRDGSLMTPQTQALPLYAAAAGTLSPPRAAWNPALKEWLVVWGWDADAASDIHYANLYFIDNEGTPLLQSRSGTLIANSHTVSDGGNTFTVDDRDFEPDVAYGITGAEFLVSYTFDTREFATKADPNPADTGTDVRAAFFGSDLSGGPVQRGTTLSLSAVSGRNEGRSRVGYDPSNDRFLAAFEFDDGAGNRDVRCWVVNASTRAVVGSSYTTVEQTASTDASAPAVAFNATAGSLSWLVAHALSAGASGTSSIVVTRFPPSGTAASGLGTPSRATLGGTLLGAAFAAPDMAARGAGGEFLAGWTVAGTAKSPANSEIRFSK